MMEFLLSLFYKKGMKHITDNGVFIKVFFSIGLDMK